MQEKSLIPGFQLFFENEEEMMSMLVAACFMNDHDGYIIEIDDISIFDDKTPFSQQKTSRDKFIPYKKENLVTLLGDIKFVTDLNAISAKKNKYPSIIFKILLPSGKYLIKSVCLPTSFIESIKDAINKVK